MSDSHSKKETKSRIETIMSHTIHDCLVYNTNVLTTGVNKFSTNDIMHLYEFSYADNNVRRMYTNSQGTTLLNNIEGGDLTALDANYQLYLLKLGNRHYCFLR